MLQQINTSSDPNTLFPIYCYAMLDDIVIGEQYCAPPMQRAWWVSRWIFFDSHAWSCWRDPRIRADIVRRLRYETPLTIDPPAPLPS
jgi:hypothetical protein